MSDAPFPKPHKISLALSQKAYNRLNDTATLTNDPIPDVIRKALRIYDELVAASLNGSNLMLLDESTGKARHITLTHR